METRNGTFVLHSELANRLVDLQKSSGFKTPEAFVQHLFSLEETIRTNRLEFATLLTGVEQPWFEKDSSNSGKSRSLGVQVNLCCRSRLRKIPKESVAFTSTSEEESSDESASDEEEEEVDLKNRRDTQTRDFKPAGVKSRGVTIKLLNKNKPLEVGHQCNECGRSFKLKVSYLNHLRVHVREDSTLQCDLCNVSFTNKWNLGQHISVKHPEQVHKAKEKTPQKKLLCHICGCAMKSQQTLKSHLRTHSADKPYQCVHCSKTFKWASALAYHIRTHTGERPHRCHKCDKAFTNRSDLTRHQTVHTGEKPHKCTQCDKAFTQGHSLTAHVDRYHRRRAQILSPGAIGPTKTVSPHQKQKPHIISFVQTSPPVMSLVVDPVHIQTNLLMQEQAHIEANLGLGDPLGGQVHNMAERDLAETMVNILPAS
ncbi:uncharacterized protein [Asterias amurensis]|uniref:uncharacterized protein n=1 Tax=Asterias amurensis TaxID=7602 RepID=UPI003AB46BF8